MSTEAIIFVGVAMYLVAMLGIGVFSAKRAGTATDFMVAGRRLPIWICSATIMATWFGGGTLLGGAGASYGDGLLGVIADPFGGALALFVVGFCFVRIFRRLKLITVVDFFQNRFGTVAAVVASIGKIVSLVGWTAALLVAFGVVFHSLTGVPVEIGIIGGAVVIVLYTVAGGMWAVALTDFVQMIIIAAGLLMLLIVVLVDVGGWGSIRPQLPEHTFRMVPLENSGGAWLNYLRAWLIIGLADVSSQALMQRGFSARNEQVAQNSFYIAGIGYLTFGMIPVILGIIGSVTMPGLADPETVIPELALAHLHPIAIAVFVGALLAAIMSSADSSLLAAASVLSNNLVPLVARSAKDRLRLLSARISIVLFGIIAVVVATEVKVVYNLMLDANSIILVCVSVPFILGVWWKKANRAGALASMLAGSLTWIGVELLAPDLPGDLAGMLAALLTMLVVTPATQVIDPPRPLLTADGEEIQLKDRLGILPVLRRAG